MDRQKIADALGIQAGTPLYLTALNLRMWGHTLHFDASAGEDVPFALVFDDCREWRWQTYTHIESGDAAFPRTELVNFRLGRGQHRSPAHLLTGYFGLSLFYGEVLLLRAGTEPKPIL